MLHKAPVQIALAFLFSFLGGSTVSLNVFTAAVDRASAHHPWAAGLWAPSCSAVFYLSSLLMAPCALHLSLPGVSRGRSVCAILFAGAMSFLTLALAGPGVSNGSALLIVAAVAATGVSLAAYTIVSLELVSQWCGSYFSLAVAGSSVVFGAGSIVSASFYHHLVNVLPVAQAIVVVAILGAALTLFFTALLRFDPAQQSTTGHKAEMAAAQPLLLHGEDGDPGQTVADRGRGRGRGKDEDNDKGNSNEKNTDADGLVEPDISAMLWSREFALFMVVVLSICAAFPVLPYFFALGMSHNASEVVCLRAYQSGTALGIAFNLLSTKFSDCLRTRDGAWSLGARNVLLVVLGMQMLSFGLLAGFDATGRFAAWAVLANVLHIFYLGSFPMITMLARDVFGQRSTAIIVGVGGGVAYMVGEAVSAGVVAAADKIGRRVGQEGGTVVVGVARFRPYYIVGAVWAGLGILALLFLQRFVHDGGREGWKVVESRLYGSEGEQRGGIAAMTRVGGDGFV